MTFLIFLIPITMFAQWEWQNPLPQGNDILDVQSISEDVGFACGKHGTVVKTTSGGSEWSLLQFPRRMNIRKLHFVSQTIGWATGKQDSIVYLYKTLDAAVTWNKQIGQNAELISAFFISESLGWMSLDSTLFRTNDGGITWIQQAVLVPITDIFFIDSTTGWVTGWNWAFGGSKVYYTSDGGNTWQFTSIDLGMIDKIKFLDTSVGWLMGRNEGPNFYSAQVLKSIDGGQSWQQQLVYEGWEYFHTFSDMEFASEMFGWVISVDGLEFRTTNGGVEWEEIGYIPHLTRVSAVDNSMLWGAGEFGAHYSSQNGGVTWQRNYVGEIVRETTELFVLNENIFFVGGEKTLLKTINGGTTWEKIDVEIIGHSYFNIRSIWFTNSLHGWIGCEYIGGGGGLFATTDGGLSWENLNHPSILFAQPKSVYFSDNENGWVIGAAESHGFMFHTSNGGLLWEVSDLPTSHSLYQIGFANKNFGWILGKWGTILNTTNGGVTFIGQDRSNKNPNNFSLSQNYPNPFNPRT